MSKYLQGNKYISLSLKINRLIFKEIFKENTNQLVFQGLRNAVVVELRLV